ncbi:unnamed protein product [Urochloa decumbens]|uniref:Protein kinase domain-containing protein n=1 Tax=Urochloa decumbens TaxID=240449 RepID=A0ABC8XIG3_9POAL
MEWAASFFGRLMRSDSSSSTSSTPWFAVDSTEPLLAVVDAPPELTARDLNKATRSFSAARLIGRGHNATVYKAVLPCGTAAAAKVLGTPPSGAWTGSMCRCSRYSGKAAVSKKLATPPPSGAWSASDDAFLRQHVSVLSMLRHDNLVRLLGYTIAPDLRVLLFEFATAGTLHDILHGPRGEPEQCSSASRPAVTLSWAQRRQIALDVARGLQYLHEAAAVSHWGVRSTNVLLFEGLRAKIGSYDVFEQLPRPGEQGGDTLVAKRTLVPTCGYLPPEYLMTGLRVPRKADVYSFGVVLLELLTGRKPVDMDNHKLVTWAIPLVRKGEVEQWIDPTLGTQYPPAGALKLARIAEQCLHKHPRSRPSMGEVAQVISDFVRD